MINDRRTNHSGGPDRSRASGAQPPARGAGRAGGGSARAGRPEGGGWAAPSGGRTNGPTPSGGRSGRPPLSGGRSGDGRGGAGSPTAGRGAGPDSSGGVRGNSGSQGRPEGGAWRGGAPSGGRGATRGHRDGSMAGDGFDRPAPTRGLGGEQVEGRQAVRELLLAGRRRVREILVADGQDQSPILAEIEELAAEAKVALRRVSKLQLEAVAKTEHPQGVVARAAPLAEADFETLMRTAPGSRTPFLIAVDGVTDPQNLGALLRSAEGAGVTGVVLPQHRSVHVTPTVTKAAAGAIERLPIALVSGLASALLEAKRRDVWSIGLDADGERTIYEFANLADAPLILVVGAEGAGMSRLVRERCDAVAAIPLRGAIASLNAATAGAIALFEFGRHRT